MLSLNNERITACAAGYALRMPDGIYPGTQFILNNSSRSRFVRIKSGGSCGTEIIMKKRNKTIAMFLACAVPVSSVLAFDKAADIDRASLLGGQYYEEKADFRPIEGVEEGGEVPPELLKEMKPDDSGKSKRFIVKYKDKKNTAVINEMSSGLSARYDIENVKELKLRRRTGVWFFSSEKEEDVHVIEVDEAVDTEEFADEVKACFDVEYVQPDKKVMLSAYGDTAEGYAQLSGGAADGLGEAADVPVTETELTEEDAAEPETAAEETEAADAAEDAEVSEESGAEDTEPGADAAETDVPPETETPAETAEADGGVNEPEDGSGGAEAGEAVIVALLDTGVDTSCEKLSGRIYDNSLELGNDEDGNGYTGDVSGWDFCNGQPEVYNADLGLEQAHGTHIAGVIADTAPDVKILPLKVFENGSAYTSDIIEAIRYAEMMGAKVVNCSWGSTEENPALEEAMAGSEMTFVCAAGNNRLDLYETPVYPACFGSDNIVSVTSVNDDGGLSYFSNYGDVDIAARGRDVESCFPDGALGTLTGTSVSAGFVSGALAGIYTDNDESLKRLYSAADKLLNLQEHVIDGRRLNTECLMSNTENDDIIDISPAEDHDTEGYTRTPAQSWELFSSLDNVSVTAGNEFLAVLKADGSVWTWGKNNYGQLGIGSFDTSLTPQQVPNLSSVKQLEAGSLHMMALTEDGTVYAWGFNLNGCLGNGTAANSNVPVKMLNTGSVEAIGIGEKVSFVIRTDGSLYICGQNYSGEQGDDTKADRTTLHKVPIDDKVISASGEWGTCMALAEGGKLYMWGSNDYGKLGNGSGRNEMEPQLIFDSGIAEASVGYYSSMALSENGEIYFWGFGGKPIPANQGKITGVSKICAGHQEEFILCGKTIKARGTNANGSLGVGDTVWYNSWQEVTGEFTDFAINSYMGAAIGTNGCIYTWGITDPDTGEYVTAPQKMDGKINNFGGDSFSEAAEVGEGLTHGNLISTSDKDYYKFTPQSSGIYAIYSISEDKDLVCKIYTMNSSGFYSLKFSNDDASGIMGGSSRDFYLSKPLTAGTDYYICVYPYSSEYEGEYELHIERESNNAGYSAYSAANAVHDVCFNVNNISSFTNRTFTLTYDPAQLALADACAFTQALDTEPGAAAGTNITVVSVSDGELVFKVTQSIPSGRKLSGTINLIRFTSLVSGYKTVNFRINDIS